MSTISTMIQGLAPKGRRRMNPTKQQAALLIAGGAAIAAFFLFGRKAKAAGAAPPLIDDDETVDPGEPDPVPKPGPKPPSIKIDVVWGDIQESMKGSEASNARLVFATRPASHKGHKRKDGQNLSSWLTNVAFWITYPNTLEWPGGGIPNKQNVRNDQHADRQQYADAWVRVNQVIMGRFAKYRDKIFFSVNPNARVVSIGKNAWTWIDTILVGPNGATANAGSVLIGAWESEYPNKATPATTAWFKAKKKMIDRAIEKGWPL